MSQFRTVHVRLLLSGVICLGFMVPTVQAQSGNLEPPTSAVNGSGDPVATTQTQPSWDQGLPPAERFVRVLPTATTPAGEAVLDKNTGLVWDQSPSTATQTWSTSRFHCMGRSAGDQKGWRLPSVHELASLVDPTVAPPGPVLPVGHPFSNIQSDVYWSATMFAGDPTVAWVVRFQDESVLGGFKADSFFVWCVRGGGPLSEY